MNDKHQFKLAGAAKTSPNLLLMTITIIMTITRRHPVTYPTYTGTTSDLKIDTK